MRIVIKNGSVVSADKRVSADVLVEDGIIIDVAENLSASGAEIINAEGCYVFPGFIDTHTHFDLELSVTTTADDFKSGTHAAVLGGTTTVLDFATQDKGGTMKAALEKWHNKAQGSNCNYGFHMAVSEWNDALSVEMEEMENAGITSYKMYMVYDALRVGDGEIYLALKRAKELDSIISIHCENYGLLTALIGEIESQDIYPPLAHALSRPALVEAEAVARYMRIAKLANAPAYVVHLSSADGLDEARRARNGGQSVYLETCPQYLLLDDSRYMDADALKFVMSPPLRKREDNEALWNALSNNEIQTIGTDHCSFTMAQKALGKADFTNIPNGCAGVQTRAMLYYTYGVMKGRVTLEQMAAQLSTNAAKLFGMYPRKGVIQKGSDADIVIWDPSAKQTIFHKTLAHNCDNTPFEGMAVKGSARDVLLNGVLAVSNGKLVSPGLGQYVFRGKCDFNGGYS